MGKPVTGLLLTSLLLVVFLTACGDMPVSSTGSAATPTLAMTSGSTLNDMNTTLISSSPSTSDPMSESLKGLSHREFEIAFLQDLIANHQVAIAMAQLAATHTTRPELITLSQEIINYQTKEMTDETTWLALWYNEKPLVKPLLAPGGVAMIDNLNTLENSKDATFDAEFIRTMLPTLERSINMTGLLPARTQRSELLQLAHNIVTEQNWEVYQLDSWARLWFLDNPLN